MMMLNAASALLPAEIKHHYRCMFCFWVEVLLIFILKIFLLSIYTILHVGFVSNYNHIAFVITTTNQSFLVRLYFSLVLLIGIGVNYVI